jgi:hypothetical protein
MPAMPRLLSLAVGAAAASIGAYNFISDKPEPKAPEKPTYAEHVAPILNKSCVPCHRPGEVAPFSLVGYDNASKWAPMISAVTKAKRMPPWKAVHGYGEFMDENILSAEQLATLENWEKTGSTRGDKDKEPPTPKFESEWPLRQPDIIISPTKPYKLDAEGDDVYRNFVIDLDIKEPMWVKAMAIKPGNPKIVHHVITFLDERGLAKKLEAQNTDGQEGYTSSGGGVGFNPTGSLGGWAPGLNVRETPEGTAFLVKPNTTLVVQVHYHKTGKPEEDLTRVGLYLAKEEITKTMDLDWIFNFRVAIPAGEKAHKVTQTRPIPVDVTLYGAMPHMHLLGRSMKAWVELPDGSTKPLVWIDDWDFNWQMSYSLKEPLKVPKGSKIQVEAIYDNSADNPRNPNNPPQMVRWGEQTTDEMFLMIVPFTLGH